MPPLPRSPRRCRGRRAAARCSPLPPRLPAAAGRCRRCCRFAIAAAAPFTLQLQSLPKLLRAAAGRCYSRCRLPLCAAAAAAALAAAS